MHGTSQQIILTTLTSTVSAGYASNEFEAAAVEHHECQPQMTMPLVTSVQGRHPSEEPRKRLQTILASMTLVISSDQTRSLQRAPLQYLQALG